MFPYWLYQAHNIIMVLVLLLGGVPRRDQDQLAISMYVHKQLYPVLEGLDVIL